MRQHRRFVEAAFVLLMAAGAFWFVYDTSTQQKSLEGDELVHVVLTEQLAHGTYTLRGTSVLQLPGFSHYIYDRAVHYNPPLYNLVLLAVREVSTPTSYVYVSLLASTLCACFVFRIARRRCSWGGASFAMLVFVGCPIMYLVTCRIWAEPLLALLICAIVDQCDRLGMEPTAKAGIRQGAALALQLAAAAMIKLSALFVLPGVFLLVARRPDSRVLARVLFGIPLLVSALWLIYVLYANQAAPPALPLADDRFSNVFVAEQKRKSALSLFYLPMWLNPGYSLALLAFTRERPHACAPFALAVLGGMFGASLIAWTGTGTYHTKYISTVLPLLAVPAGMGFDKLGRRLGTITGWSVRMAVAVALVLLLSFENAVHRRSWIAEVSPGLYSAVPPAK